MRTFSKLTMLLLLFSTSSGLSQTFSPDIVIDSISHLQIGKGLPIIDINSINEFGVSWATGYPSYAEVYFRSSNNQGQSFDSVRMVDHLNVTTTDIFLRSLKFDKLSNPVICYGYMYDYFGPAEQYIKKSLNGGTNFILNPLHIQTVSSIFTFEFVNDSLGLLLHEINNQLNEIVLKKSYDGGLSFSDTSVVPTASGLTENPISVVQCDNGDILCFWTEYEYSTHTTDIYYSRSVDQGNTFSSPISLDSTYNSANGIFSASYKNKVFIVYYAANSNDGMYIIFKKSEDFGYNYSSGIILHDYTNNVQSVHPTPEIRINSSVGLGVIWGQSIFPSDDIYFVYSSNFGESFDTTLTLPKVERRYRYCQSMAISDSGDVYIVSLVGGYWEPNNKIVLNHAKLPVHTQINQTDSHEISGYQLCQNFPNPFNLETTILFNLPNQEYAELKIHDVNGRLITTLISGVLIEGEHKCIWDGSNTYGNLVSSGVYIYHLNTSSYSQSRKLLFLK